MSCGLKHTIARTALHKIFVWGCNSHFQLGLDHNKECKVPARLSIPGYGNFRFKPRSVQASLAGGYVLLDDRQLFQFGKSGRANTPVKVPTKFSYEELFGGNRMADDFTPLRVYSKWSNTLTATYILFLDFRGQTEAKTMREKMAELINVSWGEIDTSIFPPCNEITSKHLHSKYVEKCLRSNKPNTQYSCEVPEKRVRPPPPPPPEPVVEPQRESTKAKSPSKRFSNIKGLKTKIGLKTSGGNFGSNSRTTKGDSKLMASSLVKSNGKTPDNQKLTKSVIESIAEHPNEQVASQKQVGNGQAATNQLKNSRIPTANTKVDAKIKTPIKANIK